MKKIILSFVVFIYSQMAHSNLLSQQEETFDFFKRQILEGQLQLGCHFGLLGSCEEQITHQLQAIEEVINEQSFERVSDVIDELSSENLSVANKIYLARLKKNFLPLSLSNIAEIKKDLNSKELSKKDHLYLCFYVDNNYCEEGNPFKNEDLIKQKKNVVRDLFFDLPRGDRFKKAKYSKVPRIYMFCRVDRRYPCRLIMRGENLEPVRDVRGKLWSLKTLAYSRHKKKYNEFSGNTPSGVYLVNGVMPTANKQQFFGKFRRLILDFVADSTNESFTKQLLPVSSSHSSWWKEASIARDMGRKYLRIHGTLFINNDKKSPHYGFYGTSGCVQTRENKYDGIEYVDQQKLLNQLMAEMGLDIIYKNEEEILALLYVINIDNKKKEVSLEDLREFDIF